MEWADLPEIAAGGYASATTWPTGKKYRPLRLLWATGC